MLHIERPYFLQNEDWYKFNEDECRYELTDKAPKAARESYEQFYKELESAKVYK